MARPREFDRDAVLDRAVDLFWRKGYGGTSMRDIVRATGVNPGSLYAAFDGKAELFAEVLERYTSGSFSRIILDAPADAPVVGLLRQAFARLVGEGAGARGARGCLLTNTVTELAAREPAITARATASLAVLEDDLARRLGRAKRRGEVGDHVRPRAMARFLVAVMQGIRVTSRVSPDRRVLGDIAGEALARLDAGPACSGTTVQ